MQIEGYKPAGSYTTRDVMQVMQRYAVQDSNAPALRSLANDICVGIEPDDKRSCMIAIRNWIVTNMAYVKDPEEARRLFGIKDEEMEHGDLEMVKSPLATLESMRYDCDCIASFISAILMNLGIQARLVAVSFQPAHMTGPDEYSHVFAQGYDGQEWIVIDPVSYPTEKQMLKDVVFSDILPVY